MGETGSLVVRGPPAKVRLVSTVTFAPPPRSDDNDDDGDDGAGSTALWTGGAGAGAAWVIAALSGAAGSDDAVVRASCAQADPNRAARRGINGTSILPTGSVRL